MDILNLRKDGSCTWGGEAYLSLKFYVVMVHGVITDAFQRAKGRPSMCSQS